MGIIKGSITLSRYRLVGEKLKSHKQIDKHLEKFKSPPIKINGTPKELRVGWVLPDSIYQVDERMGNHWSLSDCYINDGYLLRVRVVRRKVPSELLQVLLKQKLLNKSYAKKKIKEVKDELHDTLLNQSLPTITYIDAFWSENGSIHVFTSSKKNREIFEDLFRKTFAAPLNSSLVPMSPPLMGMSSLNWGKATPTNKYIKSIEPILPTTQSLSESIN